VNTRYGTIEDALGKHIWKVKLDEGSTEEFKSQQLQIYKEYYNKPSETPIQKAASTIKRIIRKTVSKKARTNNLSSSSSESQSDDDDSSASTNRDKDENYEPEVEFSTQIDDEEVEVLLTPRPPTPSPGRPTRPRTLFEEVTEASLDDSRRSNHSFDDFIEDEEDILLPTSNLEDDGEDQCDFVDVPQKATEFQNATKLMNEKKKELMGTTIVKTVKPTNKYAPGGLVEGAPNTQKEGKKGTIIDQVEEGFYLIEWDDVDLPDSRVEKKHLRLQKGISETYVWKFVENHVADNPPAEYQKHGVIGLSSERFDDPNILNYEDPDYDHPFAKLVEQLWPGDWRSQLSNLNKHIQTECKGIKQIDNDEWWTFWGIMAFAAGAGKGGEEKLWDTKQALFQKELPPVDLSDHMKLYRFKQIKKNMPKAFVGKDEEDPWNAIKGLVDGFNNSRARDIAASFTKVHDESMSSWKTRTTKLGGLPFLSFILRKPKPLGTEFKVTADTETGKY
jgi:hypothetical protein